MRILAIEFGGWSLKAVEMESRFRRMEVLELHEIPLPLQNLDPTANYRAAVQQLMARLPSHPEKIVTSLPAGQTSLRFLNIPLKQRKKVEQSFHFELEDAVPFKLDEAIVEHHVQPMGDGSLVFAAIAPKKHITSYLEWLKSIGVDPDWLTFEGMGVTNLFFSSLSGMEVKPTEPIAVLDIGHVKTNLAILHEGRLQLFRSIAWGGLAVSQSIASALVVPLDEAEGRKVRDFRLDGGATAKNSEQEELIAAGTRALATLMTDLSHSLVAFRSQYKREVTSLCLTGGTSKIRGLDGFIEKSLGMKTTLFSPFSYASFAREVDRSLEARFGEPLGRALVYSRKSEVLFNFRKEEMGKGTSLSEITAFFSNPAVLKLGKYAFILAFILFAGVFALGYVAQEEAKRDTDKLKQVFGETFREVNQKQRTAYTSDPKELKKYIDLKNNELNEKLKMISRSRTTMISLLRSISEAFPAEVRVDVNTLSIDDKAMRMEGVLYKGELTAVTESLKKVGIFSNIDLKLDGKRFTYRADVVGR